MFSSNQIICYFFNNTYKIIIRFFLQESMKNLPL